MLQDKINRVIEICGGWGLYETGASTAQKQMMYAATELAEFTKHFLEGKTDMLSDDIGDTAVCLINAYYIENYRPIRQSEYPDNYGEFHTVESRIGRIGEDIHFIIHSTKVDTSWYMENIVSQLFDLSLSIGRTLESCIAESISVIEKRKGKIVNGVFIKEA